MSKAQGTTGSSSPHATALGQILTFFGSVAEYAAGFAPDEVERVASLAIGMGRLAGLSPEELDALYFAARLRSVGALGNLAFSKDEGLPERVRLMHRWDIPAASARICEGFGALPAGTAEIVRWQAECWDGTGSPDQLRWFGITKSAQLLHIAATYVAAAEPEEALAAITAESGRSFAPEQVRTFVMWFHTFGGEIAVCDPPFDAIGTDADDPSQVLELLATCIDAHNATPGKAHRIAAIVGDLARALDFEAADVRRGYLGALLVGIGELRAPRLEASQFDPLARLGVETRTAHALAAAQIVSTCPFLAELEPVLRARAEWYDGTGGPDGLRHGAISRAGHAIAIALAYDAIDEAYRSRITEERTLPIARLETASGTQFDPHVVRALAKVVKERS